MFSLKRDLLALVVSLAFLSSGKAGVIDFESYPLGPVPGDTLVVNVDGLTVTFTANGLNIRTLPGSFPNPNKVLSTIGDSSPLTITFSGGTANFVKITNLVNGTYTGEVDVISGQAFDAFDNPLDMATNSNTIHQLNGPGIAKIVYDDVNTGYVIDDFTFQAAVIPEPASLALAALVGVAGGVYARRRKARVA